jgi:hypothetical protein
MGFFLGSAYSHEGLAKLPTNKGSKLLLTPNEPVFERVALFSLS